MEYQESGDLTISFQKIHTQAVGKSRISGYETGHEYLGLIRFYEEEKITNTTRSYFSFLPSIKVNWLRKDNWGMYSKVAAGVTYAHFNKKSCVSNDQETVNDLLFNFHVSLLGIEAGSQHVRGFAELGVGEQGVALAGVRFKF